MSQTENQEVVPKVGYHAFYNTPGALYRVELNPRKCGIVLRLAGLTEQQIRQSSILISPETNPREQGFQFSGYDDEEKEFYLYPTTLWQALDYYRSIAELLITGQTIFSKIDATGTFSVISRIQVRADEQNRAEFDKILPKATGVLIRKDAQADFLTAVRSEKDLDRVELMLKAGVERVLLRELAREAKLSLESPPTLLERRAREAVARLTPFAAAFLGVSIFTVSHPSQDAPIWAHLADKAVITYMCLYFYLMSKRISPKLAQIYNPRARRAGKFAQEVEVDHPDLYDLAKIHLQPKLELDDQQ
ncbi:hypothetical protein HYS93_00735 [Candidatus Daviesbacteria bacterium]|nr:hypothetical protein [Candidatus Daviesbacteria bacterium]